MSDAFKDVMQGLTTVPGVIGGMLSDDHGNVLSHTFPPLFDQATIKGAADMMTDNTIGLQEATGGVKLFDIRFELGRLIVKPLPRMFLAILGQPNINIQLLSISLNVAIKKLEKIALDQVPQQKPAPPPAAPAGAQTARQPAPAYSDYRAMTDAKGVLLSCEVLKKTAGTFWDSMTDHASVNRNTAIEISNYFNTGPFKKLTITNLATGTSKHVPVSIIQHDRDHSYDGRIIISLALAELLKVTDDSQVRVEVVVGGGIFGWEGI
jgi:predicted regulator of Ras-like GTPase activity (Roadblock/LC7/MglB family)